jgi:hypothetical protein
MRALSIVPLGLLLAVSASCPGPFGGSAPNLEEAPATALAKVAFTAPAPTPSVATQKPAPPPPPRELDEDLAGTKLDWGAAAVDEPDDDDADNDADDAVVPPAPTSDATKSTARAADPAEFGEATPVLASIARETWIFSEPSKKSRRIGYLRAGAVVPRSEKRVGTAGCKGGWYKIDPRGFVCIGRTATLDAKSPVVLASKRRPRLDGLPYDYVLSRNPTAPLYARVPTAAEQAKVETDLGYHLRKMKALEHDKDFVPLPEAGSMPEPLQDARPLPALADAGPRDPSRLVVGQARIRSGYALLAQFDVEGRRFGVTPDLFLVPLDRTRWVKPSSFHGVELGGEITLPVAFVMKRHATRFEADASGHMRAGGALGFREAVALTGKGERGYLEAKDGSWVREEDVRRIDPPSREPSWATEGRRWVDVSILKQALVAYDGPNPKYVTLVSTGADGLGDPKKTHSTIQGVFLIHTKHITVTMDGDEAGDEFDLRDVPFVQYFTEGYALHGAYWHDDFGTPRSHGCVNLAPLDAAWLFGWTTPDVPAGWHASLSLKKGTLVYTHP